MPAKKLKVDIPEPNPEIAQILEKLKVKGGVVPEEPKKISDRQKEHLEAARVKAIEGKKQKEEKIKFLESYYLEQEKARLNALKEKEIYKKRKERTQKKASPPTPIEDPMVEEETDEEEIESEDLQPEYEEDESEEEEVVVIKKVKKPLVKAKPAKVVVPVKKKTQPVKRPVSSGNTQSKIGPPSNQGYNPFQGIM